MALPPLPPLALQPLTAAVRVQVEDPDLQRVVQATGAKVQTTVNNLDVKVLGTCTRFEERQVRACHPAGCSK